MKVTFLIQGISEVVPIYVRVRDGRSLELKMKTNFTIKGKDWNKKGYVRHKNDDTLSELSLQLQILKTKIMNQMNLDKGKLPIDKDWLSKIISPIENISIDETESFSYQLNLYLQSKEDSITKSTIDRYKRVNSIFLKVAKKLKIDNLKFNNIDNSFLIQLNKYFKEQEFNVGYKAKLVKTAQTIVKYANSNNVPTLQYIFQQQYKSEDSTAIYLTEKEIKRIAEYKFDDEILDVARDWLLISIETATRVSEFLEFNSSNIESEYNEDGLFKVIVFLASKTQKLQRLPIRSGGHIEKILDKRNGEFPPKLYSTKYNKLIKEVGRVVGINDVILGEKQINGRKIKGEFPKYELMSSHIGRRTFATILRGKIPTTQIMAMTGHTRESTFNKYVRSTAVEKARDLKKYIDSVQF